MKVVEHGEETKHDKKLVFNFYQGIHPRMREPFKVGGADFHILDSAFLGEPKCWVLYPGGTFFKIVDTTTAKAGLLTLYDIACIYTDRYLDGELSVEDLQEFLDLVFSLTALLNYHDYLPDFSDVTDFYPKLHKLFRDLGFEITDALHVGGE